VTIESLPLPVARIPLRGKRSRGRSVALHATLIVASLIAVFPVFWVLVTSFKPDARAVAPTIRLFDESSLANYGDVLSGQQGDFLAWVANSVEIALLTTVIAVFLSATTGYAVSRFRFPGKNGLFLLLLATIILPFQITLIPTFAVFLALGWTGTWLPLLVPHFFANAYNVFLLRQYFVTIPRELDEAAMMDGASPLRVLISVIVPQSIPVLTAVGLFHFFFAWNDFFQPLIYLQGNIDLQPLSVGIAVFNALYSQKPTLIQAAAVMSIIVPVAIFFFAQRAFMRGVVITGVEK